ncbi:nicotinate (nicotinamide) nucleotide adenylyltransferase [Aliikangiella marina]|uniref:Probable nicotinate-nucleotide adenylyltransferase n=1 Tax=Aliikangiella marina TaxID=1712262 RepID=A0A545T9S9_9GAMM|nr:nicotinate (nicotinamide) nucleotide adenylyltransferase [Aliikangiella marina]TQV73971.1 nicotinate (nicotinamide) nucleotide adenylyltransferase [Aliikangiella marina]
MKRSECEFVFGGTFDPVHLGHLEIVKSIGELAPSCKIRLLPCAIPALKGKPQTSFQHRVNMLSLVAKDYPNVSIDQREFKRCEKSYTLDTLVELQRESSNKLNVFVMGADSLATFESWYRWQEINQFCHLLIFNRADNNDYQLDKLVAAAGFSLVDHLEDLTSKASGLALLHTMPDMPQASSEIRKAIQAGIGLDSLLPQSVIEYISRNHLYESE